MSSNISINTQTKTETIRSFRDDLQRMLSCSPTLKDLLTNNARLPHGEFVAKVVGTVMGNKTLQECSVHSIMQCCLKSAQLGLPVDASGYAYLIPKKNEATYQIGSKGYIELIKRNKNVKSVVAETVYEGDIFDYYIDETGKHLNHKPNLDVYNREEESGFKAVYAIITYDNGGSEIEVMSRSTINKIKGVASSQNIWNAWYGEKAKTSVIKRLGKRASLMNVDMAISLEEDEKIDNTEIKQVSQPKSIDDLVDDYVTPANININSEDQPQITF